MKRILREKPGLFYNIVTKLPWLLLDGLLLHRFQIVLVSLFIREWQKPDSSIRGSSIPQELSHSQIPTLNCAKTNEL
jgi:hypothetical protein